MTILSENGWPARPDTSTFTRAEAQCSDGVFAFWAANPDVAVVFTEYIERHDHEVESVVQPKLDDWSYANRMVRGSVTRVSNHGSATAIDLNALKYPLGTKHMSTAKQSAARAIRRGITDNSGRPVLRLGMDYVGRVDQMHVEIFASPAQVRQAADKIREERAMALSDQDVDRIATATAAKVLASKVELSAAAARHLGRTAGEKVSVSYLLQWGGPGLARLAGDVEDLTTAHETGTTE